MLWAVFILFSFIVCLWLWKNYERLNVRVYELEQSDIARGFVKEEHESPWHDMEPVDADLPDMSEEVTIDDLT